MHGPILSRRMQTAQNYTSVWCGNQELNINPSKTTLIPFTLRRKMEIRAPILNGTELKFSSYVKYLGINIDTKLTWNKHLEQVVNKAKSALWVCQKTFGMKWGLNPKMIYWTYLTIVLPKISYGALVWWPKTMEKTAQMKLAKLQRLATTSIIGAMRSTPSAALDALLDVLPLHQFLQLEAERTAHNYFSRRRPYRPSKNFKKL